MSHSVRFLGLILLFLIFGMKISCSQKDDYVPKYSTILSSTEGGNMSRQCSRSFPYKVESYFDLTNDEVKVLENNFQKVLRIKASHSCQHGGNIKSLNDYVFQYIGLVINNHKYVYINAFQATEQDLNTFFKNWKTKPLIFCDGGDSNWGVLCDLETGKFSQLSINGIA